MSASSFPWEIIQSTSVWCPTCETLVTKSATNTCHACRSICEDSFLIQEMLPKRTELNASIAWPGFSASLITGKLKWVNNCHWLMMQWLTAVDYVQLRSSQSRGIIQRLATIFSDFVFRLRILNSKMHMTGHIVGHLCPVNATEQQFRLMRGLEATQHRFFWWVGQHPRGAALQIDAMPPLEGLARMSSVEKPFLMSSDKLYDVMDGMGMLLLLHPNSTTYRYMRHYNAYWNMPAFDLKTHPFLVHNAILQLSTGVKCCTLLVQPGSRSLPQYFQATLVDLKQHSTTGDRFTFQQSAMVMMGPDLCFASLTKIEQAGASAIIVVAGCGVASCELFYRSTLLEHPLGIPIVMIDQSDAKKLLKWQTPNGNESLKCKLTIEASELECPICAETMDRVVRLPACRHFMHERCAIEWLSQNLTCPFCRTALTGDTDSTAP